MFVYTCGESCLTFQIEADVALLALVRDNRTVLSSFDDVRLSSLRTGPCCKIKRENVLQEIFSSPEYKRPKNFTLVFPHQA